MKPTLLTSIYMRKIVVGSFSLDREACSRSFVSPCNEFAIKIVDKTCLLHLTSGKKKAFYKRRRQQHAAQATRLCSLQPILEIYIRNVLNTINCFDFNISWQTFAFHIQHHSCREKWIFTIVSLHSRCDRMPYFFVVELLQSL